MGLWDLLLGRSVRLVVKEDNEATIQIAKDVFTQKLRHVLRHHRVNYASVSEVVAQDNMDIEQCPTDLQKADIFTAGLEPAKWLNAIDLLDFRYRSQVEHEIDALKFNRRKFQLGK